MGFKKHEEKEVKELDVSSTTDMTNETSSDVNKEKERIDRLIEENSKEEEELKKLPLDDLQKEVYKLCEESRKEYTTFATKQRKINTWISSISLVLIVASVVIIMALPNISYLPWIVFGCMAAMLLGVFIFTKITKNKLNDKADEYIKTLYNTINNYLYRDTKLFSNFEFKPKSQMKDEVFIDARFYKNLRSTRSRNFVEVDYNGKLLSMADLAGIVLIKNKTAPMFLGRFYDYPNSYKEKDKRIILQIKGGELSRPIDDVDDLELKFGNDKYCIYSNDPQYSKVLTSKVISLINKIKIDKTVIDVIVSIREGKTNIGIDYADEFMNIPVESEFNFDNIKIQERDLKKVLAILDEIK